MVNVGSRHSFHIDYFPGTLFEPKEKKKPALLIYHHNIILLNEKILLEPKEILLE